MRKKRKNKNQNRNKTHARSYNSYNKQFVFAEKEASESSRRIYFSRRGGAVLHVFPGVFVIARSAGSIEGAEVWTELVHETNMA